MKQRKTVQQRIIEALTEFKENLESGVPIEATEVRRVETPDGPMHLRRHKVIELKSPDPEAK